MENTETAGWLDFALACKYLNETKHAALYLKNEEVGKMLGHVINYPEKYLPRKAVK